FYDFYLHRNWPFEFQCALTPTGSNLAERESNENTTLTGLYNISPKY
ncbi:MAG: hypothetical protein ACI83I_002796, partial [Bacteroidia bacterium]